MSKNSLRKQIKRQKLSEKDTEVSGQNRSKTKIILSVLIVVILVSVSIYEVVTIKHESPISITTARNANYSYPSTIDGFSKITSAPTTINGKIPLLYIGSLACPYCAEISWSIYTSLKLSGGSWSGLSYIYSNATDRFPDTPGLSFANATLLSSMMVFNGYETSYRNWQQYQNLNLTNKELFSQYDPSGNIPFILIGNMYLHIGDFYPPSVLSNTSGNSIMSWLNNGTSNNITDYIQNASAKLTQVINELKNHTSIQYLVGPMSENVILSTNASRLFD